MSKVQSELSKPRIGLIGVGNVGQIHLNQFVADEDINLVAIVEPRPEILQKCCDDFDLAGYSSVEQLLGTSSIDVACVATPVSTHESIVLACASAGVHSLCEKPLALTRASASNMIEKCNAAGVTLGYAASYRYLPAIICARQIIQSGALGEVRAIQEQAVGGMAVGGRKPMSPIHYPVGGPGGSGMGLVDHGIHLIDIFEWLLDSAIVRVEGRGNRTGQPLQTEWMAMEFSSGAVGNLLYNENVHAVSLPNEGVFSLGAGPDVEQGKVSAGGWSSAPGAIHVSGTKGALRILHYANRLFLRDDAGLREVPVEGAPPPAHFAAQMRAFSESVANKSDAPVPADLGARALSFLLDVYDE